MYTWLYIYIYIFVYIYIYICIHGYIYIIYVILYIPMCPYCLTGRCWQPSPLLDARSQRIYETIDKRSKKAQVHFGVKVQGGTSQLWCFLFCQLHNCLYGLPNVYIYIYILCPLSYEWVYFLKHLDLWYVYIYIWYICDLLSIYIYIYVFKTIYIYNIYIYMINCSSCSETTVTNWGTTFGGTVLAGDDRTRGCRRSATYHLSCGRLVLWDCTVPKLWFYMILLRDMGNYLTNNHRKFIGILYGVFS